MKHVKKIHIELPTDANSICLVSPNMAVKCFENTILTNNNVAVKAAKEAHLANLVSHYNGTAQIKNLCLDQALLAIRPCFHCNKRKNVVAGAWICGVCNSQAPYYVQMKAAINNLFKMFFTAV